MFRTRDEALALVFDILLEKCILFPKSRQNHSFICRRNIQCKRFFFSFVFVILLTLNSFSFVNFLLVILHIFQALACHSPRVEKNGLVRRALFSVSLKVAVERTFSCLGPGSGNLNKPSDQLTKGRGRSRNF